MAKALRPRGVMPVRSSPTRRVTQALLPPLFLGFVLTVLVDVCTKPDGLTVQWLLPVWMGLYGCALHAAGFFMPRGVKLFGWGFIVVGCGLAGHLATVRAETALSEAHLLMGGTFGGFHLAYGTYLYFTEKKRNQA